MIITETGVHDYPTAVSGSGPLILTKKLLFFLSFLYTRIPNVEHREINFVNESVD